ncbi:hypothetical protein FACS189435_1630 [Bacteroidia bacterium]|nr:hypothetical protein FACS189435_1630 [Bacteroidia bacterium]
MAEKQINYDRDILLVADKKSGRLKAVAGMSEDGKKIKTVEPSVRNERMFLTVGKNSGDMEKFFQSFMSRSGDPSGTEFYKMSVNGLEMGVNILGGLIGGKLNPEYIASCRVHPQDYMGAAQEHDPKVILTQGDDGKLKAVAEGKDGKLKKVDPTKENADSFLKIDPRGNALENFFQKFTAQFKNPSHTGIYAVSGKAVDMMAAFLDKIIRINPEDKVLDPYRVTPEGKMQEQAQGKYQPLDLNKLE